MLVMTEKPNSGIGRREAMKMVSGGGAFLLGNSVGIASSIGLAEAAGANGCYHEHIQFLIDAYGSISDTRVIQSGSVSTNQIIAPCCGGGGDDDGGDGGGGGGGGDYDPNNAPNASFDYSPTAPITYDVVTFDAGSSSDGDGYISTHEWDFGDGDTSSGVSASNTYTETGDYTVTLTVTDNDGATDTTQRTVSVGNTGPTASFSYSPTSPLTNESISFDASSSTDGNGVITSYEWHFGDGSTASGRTPTHSYSYDGEFTVYLEVHDDNGASNSTTRTVSVQNRKPTVSISSDSDVAVNCYGAEFVPAASSVEISFTADAADIDGNVTSYEWDFGDGTTASGQTVSHSFSETCAYDVTVTVTDDDGLTASTTELVVVGMVKDVEVTFASGHVETHRVIRSVDSEVNKFVRYVKTSNGIFQFDPNQDGLLLT